MGSRPREKVEGLLKESGNQYPNTKVAGKEKNGDELTSGLRARDVWKSQMTRE